MDDLDRLDKLRRQHTQQVRLLRNMQGELMTLQRQSNADSATSMASGGGADATASSGAAAGGLAGIFGRGGGKAIKKHADNRPSLRAVGLLVAFVAVPILFLSYANSAAKPLSVTSRETMTAAYASLSNYRVATSPGFFVGTSVPTQAARLIVASPYFITAVPTETPTPSATATPTVTLTPSATFTPSATATATATYTPSATATATATATPIWTLRVAVSALSPKAFRSDAGVWWAPGSELDGRVAGCPAELPLGAEIVLESGEVYLCIQRALKRSCQGDICSIWVYTAHAFPDRIERAYIRKVRD